MEENLGGWREGKSQIHMLLFAYDLSGYIHVSYGVKGTRSYYGVFTPLVAKGE